MAIAIRPSGVVLAVNLLIVALVVAANQWVYGYEGRTVFMAAIWMLGNVVGFFIHKLFNPTRREHQLRKRLEVVLRGMMVDIQTRNPADFAPGAPGWTCPHMKRMDELLTQIERERRLV